MNTKTAARFFQESTDEDFNRWLHHPVSKAFWQFLSDQRQEFREMAADLVEAGRISDAGHTDSNIFILSGRLRALAELAEIRLPTLQEFYSARAQAAAGSEKEGA